MLTGGGQHTEPGAASSGPQQGSQPTRSLRPAAAAMRRLLSHRHAGLGLGLALALALAGALPTASGAAAQGASQVARLRSAARRRQPPAAAAPPSQRCTVAAAACSQQQRPSSSGQPLRLGARPR